MQLCALSDENLIFAYKAVKQKDYSCLECRKNVRVRGGNHRQAHFFHTEPNRKCRQHSKGLPHLMVQYYLKNLIPEGECEIECRFPEISRIADVAWTHKKIIFEIQYSPISAVEVEARNLSYESIGYKVIWILFEGRFNQFNLTQAEDVLVKRPHYFTNMNELGSGFIYDQFSIVQKGIRTYRLPKLPIDLSRPYDKETDMDDTKNLRKIMQYRKTWGIGFEGDVLHYLNGLNRVQDNISDDSDLKFLKTLKEMPESYESLHFTLEYIDHLYYRFLKRPYKVVFQALLERACS